MAGNPRNLEAAAQGTSIVLDVSFFNYPGGVLTNTDSLPTYVIKSPLGATIQSGIGVQTGMGKYETTYAVPFGAQLSNLWTINWNAEIGGIVVPDSWEYFTVLPVSTLPAINLPIISSDWIKQIKKVLAFPAVPSVLLTDDEIKYYCVFQALFEYFIKFPKETRYQVVCNGPLTVPFPDAETYGITDVRAVNKFSQTGKNSSFWDVVRWNKYNKGYTNRSTNARARYYNFNGLSQALIAERQVLDTVANNVTYTHYVNSVLKQLELFSSSYCEMLITWASKSNNFENDVLEEYKWDVIELSQAYLLMHLADTGGIVSDSTLEKQVATDALKSRAEEIKTRIKDKWEQIPDVIVIRQS